MPTNEIAPLVADWISRAVDAAPDGHIPLLFLSGAQGSGKSTALCAAIESLPFPICGASLDDFYLTRADRTALARSVSSLFITRGPPGTHDGGLLQDTLIRLRQAGSLTRTPIPSFNKLEDDRATPEDWPIFIGRPVAIVIEGWLMGALPAPPEETSMPLNSVEAEDVSGAWRAFQEQALSTVYAQLWNEADSFCHILAPAFSCVESWRLQQEESLWRKKGEPMPEARQAWLSHFIAHYERITRRMLAGHFRTGKIIRIDADRKIIPDQTREP